MQSHSKHNKIAARSLVYGGAVFLLAVLQSTILARLRPFGAVPDLMLPAVITLSVIEGERTAAIAGVGAGFLAESIGGVGLSLLPVYYMLCGYVCGVIALFRLRRNFASWAVYMLFACISRIFISLIYAGATFAELKLPEIAAGILLPEFLATAICAAPVYLIIKSCARIFHNKEKLKG